MPTCSYPSSPLISRCPYMHFPTRLPPHADPIDLVLDFPQGFSTLVYVFAFLSFRVPSVIFKSCFLKHSTVGPGRGPSLQDKLDDVLCLKTFLLQYLPVADEMQHAILFSLLYFFNHLLSRHHIYLLYIYIFFHSHITPHLNWIDIVPESKEIWIASLNCIYAS